jgi:hypothetical protein
MRESELQRILDRAGVSSAPADLHPLAYRDRHGDVHLPLEAVAAVARSFAAASRKRSSAISTTKPRRCASAATNPASGWHEYLRENSPGFALARQWAGLEHEAAMLREEIARLRLLVSRAAADHGAAGAEAKSRRLLRALDGR